MAVELEKYRGTKSRHTCPSCNRQNSFTRYITDNGEYLSDDVGRCNRESKCGYEYKPKQFFADNSTAYIGLSERYAKPKKRSKETYGFTNKNGSQVTDKATITTDKPDYIPFEQFKPTLDNYDRNAFVQFLFDLFPDCSEEIQAVLKMYLVGTYDHYTCFPQIDRQMRICKAKLIRFNPATGNVSKAIMTLHLWLEN